MNFKLTAGIVTLLSLAACGGGDESAPTPPPPEPPAPTAAPQGLYVGSISGSTSTAFQALVLENGDIWGLYGVPSGSTFGVRGFVQGPTTITGSSFSSTSVKDFGYLPAVAGSTSGTITSSSMSGSFSAGSQTATFNGTPPTAVAYDYNAAANLASVTGSWTLTGMDLSSATVTISSAGALAGSSAGCSFSGTIAPRVSGKNVFDVTIVMGSSPCPAPGSTSTGIAVNYAIAGTAQRELVVASVNASRTAGNAFFGVR